MSPRFRSAWNMLLDISRAHGSHCGGYMYASTMRITFNMPASGSSHASTYMHSHLAIKRVSTFRKIT
ncbi:hypothetical protein PAXRUDRAFT_434733, partial [Paxillus rubicundulus Ve08.2h10]